ncbi:MAG: class I SAM-dependent rRNA methyltransferase [Chlamydiota bacterium]
MSDQRVVLKPGREKSLLNKHPWIFSGAVAEWPLFENGEILPVFSASGNFLAQAYFHRENSIAGRVLAFTEAPIRQVIEERLSQAIALRKQRFSSQTTNAYRLVNSEGDFLPGLVIDLYDDVAVLQVNTCGMERLKSLIVELLKTKLTLRGIYEKSHSSARTQDGLSDSIGVLFGDCPKEVIVKENGVSFLSAIQEGQKTGFFLDQREMRQLIMRCSSGKKVLNCFSYTGGFSLFALQGGARHVVSVDCSEEACRLARENTLLNNFDLSAHEVVQADVFEYLKDHALDFDVVILDPPAFAKRRQDVNNACRGYKEINRMAMQKLPPNSLLLSSTCSHFVDDTLFQQVLFQAAIEAKREVEICGHHIQAADHPISLFHPEGKYLKSFLLRII